MIGARLGKCFLAALLGAMCPRPARSQSTAITHVTVIDVAAGRRLRNETVIIRGNRIMDMGARAPLPRDARVVDGKGK